MGSPFSESEKVAAATGPALRHLKIVLRGRHNPIISEEFRMDSSLFDADWIEGGTPGA
jgi:hypothetical protein